MQNLEVFHATPAENALLRIVAIKGIARIDLVGFGLEGCLDVRLRGDRSVVDGAVVVVIVADSAVEQMIAQDVVEGLTLRCLSLG